MKVQPGIPKHLGPGHIQSLPFLAQDLATRTKSIEMQVTLSGWWFGTCFSYTGNNHPN